MRVWLVFTAKPRPLSWVIRWLTSWGGKYADVSHVLILFWSQDLAGYYVMEALPDGFTMRPARQAETGEWKRAYLVNVSVEKSRALLRYLSRRLQTGYDFFSIFGWAAAGIGNKLVGRGRWQPRYEVEDRWYCSEAIAAGLKAAGIPLRHVTLNPFQLAEFCEGSTALKRIEIGELVEVLG